MRSIGLGVLTDAKFAANVIPVIGFKFINLDQLHSELYSSDEYSCLVLTSPRSAEAVHHAFVASKSSAMEWRDVIGPRWSTKMTFVVGEATSAAASSLGLKPFGAASGNVSNLALFIAEELVKRQLADKPVLLPCGQLSLETLPNFLSERDITVRSLTVYETVADENLDGNIKTYVEAKGVPKHMVFFSPSTVTFSKDILERYECFGNDVQLIAIGPTTAAAMMTSFGRVNGIATSPTPQSVCDIINKLKPSINT